MLWCKLLLVVSVGVAYTKADDIVQLSIPQGVLEGKIAESVLSKKQYYSFKGIPYAKANVGVNKFNAAEAAEAWSGVLDATQHRSPCPFFCVIRKGMQGNEDCLFLNVYSPDINKDAQKAVMVWFHGGAFNMGNGDDDVYGPDFLLEEDVIVVTVNSRLGAIGFLSTADENAPGNAGLKDQVMALKWIKDNIQFFGGSPEKVTLFGQSSGAASVHYHLLSPMSEGLFSAAIMQSGLAVNSFAITYNPREMAFKLGELLDISTSDSAELVKQLSMLDAKSIITATLEMAKQENITNGHIQPFVPSIEPDVGKEIFLPADPWDILTSGKVANVPIISGLTAEESVLFLPFLLPHLEQLVNHLESFVPYDLNVTDPAKQHEMAAAIKSFYFNNKVLSKESMHEFEMLLTDVMFTTGIALGNKVMSTRNFSPVYEYLFTYESPFGLMKNVFNVEKGVSHGDELGYMFYSNIFMNLPAPGSPAEYLTRMFVKMWANFAKTGNPTPTLDDKYVKVNWEPRGKEGNYLDININSKMEKNLLKERVDFWTGMYKDVLGHYA
ncbi:juvenile hormone esterase-like [Prorops nasuta]|uniref:juvenile hormone esterase-like n=1 Tax=Prorops nasuta TaxID=863751 RepID=UPI0034CE5CB7